MNTVYKMLGNLLRKRWKWYTQPSMHRHITAPALIFVIAFSAVAVPTEAAMHASAGSSTGIMSVIRRALERKRARLDDQPSRIPSQRTSPQSLVDLHERVVDRRKERETRLENQMGKNKESEVPGASELAERLLNRHSLSLERKREREIRPDKELSSLVEQRRRLREAEHAQERRERDEEHLQRSVIQTRRREQMLHEQQQRFDERRTLREERAILALKRDQYAKLRTALLERVNHERRRAALPLLTYNKDLEMSAQLHAEDMLIRDYFDHFTPEGSSYVDRIKSIGYANVDTASCNCTAFKAVIGENIAMGQRSINWVMNEWMESPSHKKNILSPHFTEMGVGIADRIWVQNFGAIELTPR